MKKIAMILCVLMLFIGRTTLSTTISSPTDGQLEINSQQKREQEERTRALERGPRNFSNVDQNKISKEYEEKGTEIRNIVVNGNSVLDKKILGSLIDEYVGKKGGQNIINFIKELENKYLDKGYVTTRVKLDAEKSDIESGNFVFQVLEGKIDNIVLKSKESRIGIKKWATFPMKKGDMLRIQDLDQVMDNLMSIRSNVSEINVLAGDTVGGSIVELTNSKKRRISGYIGYNDLGQSSVGKDRGSISITIDDILGMNDSFTGVYQRKLWKKKKYKNNESYYYYYRIPIKYWEFVISREESEYITSVAGNGNRYKFNGNSINHNFGVNRTIYRDGNGKIGVGLLLTAKKTTNYFEGVKLLSSSRKLTVGRIDINMQRKILGGFFYFDVAYYRGLGILGALKDAGKDSDEPRSKYDKYTFDLNWYRPFTIGSFNRFAYRMTLSGQYTKDILYASEKLTIGDDVTVRGFKDSSLMGDKGVYMRNELSYRYRFLEPFIGFDIGRVKDNSDQAHQKKYGDQISGMSIGVRAKYKNMDMSLTYSKALSAPSGMDKKNYQLYFSVGIRF